MNKLISFLSNRYVSLAIIFVSIATRIINVLFVSYYGRDKMFLVLQSKSLLEGKGLAVPQYVTSNTVIPVYDITPLWPPGYPILLAPFLKLFNYNIYWATTTLDIIFCVALIFVIRKICRQIGLPAAAVNIMTLIAGCFEYTFINESLPTDSISIVLFLVSFGLLIKLLASKDLSIKKTVFVSFLLFLPCLFRYNYPAISLSVIAGILFIGFIKKDGLLKRKGWWLFVFTSLFTAVFFILMKLLTGHAGYATPTGRGFYPENAVHWFPVVPSSFINIAFLTSQAIHLASISFKTSMDWLEITNAVITISLLIFFLTALFRKKTFEDLSSVKLFLLLGAFASTGLFALLGYMSLTYKMQTGYSNNWNYVYEPRYFAFAVLFIQVAFLSWYFIFYKKILTKNIFIKILVGICFFSLFVEIFHNIYFYTRVAFNFKKYKSAVYREQDYSYYISLINEIKVKYPDYEIWAAAPGDNFYSYLATYHGYIGVADANNLKNNAVKVKTKTLLILMLYDHEINAYSTFLSSTTILHTEKRSNSNFYEIELKP
jgi:hypothetical protein